MTDFSWAISGYHMWSQLHIVFAAGGLVSGIWHY